jgi:hypothetical protein
MAADAHPSKRQNVDRRVVNVQPDTRRSARAPRPTARAIAAQ